VNPSSPNTESIIIREMQEAARAKGVQLPILKARPVLEGVVGSG
jgi:hypothetical protein